MGEDTLDECEVVAQVEFINENYLEVGKYHLDLSCRNGYYAIDEYVNGKCNKHLWSSDTLDEMFNSLMIFRQGYNSVAQVHYESE